MALKMCRLLCLQYFASIVWFIVTDAGMMFKYSVSNWGNCDSGDDAFLKFRIIPVHYCLLECRIRNRCKAVQFLTIRRECGLLETSVNMATRHYTLPCVFIRMTEVEDIIRVPTTCQNCSANQVCDIVAGSCEREVTCESNWLKSKTSCYFFSKDKKDFAEAQEYCLSRDAHLIHIETSVENEFIKRQVKHNSAFWWIGITYQAEDDEWILTPTNSVAGFFDWNRGEPNNKGGREECAVIRNAKSWHDVPCTWRCEGTICEKSL